MKARKQRKFGFKTSWRHSNDFHGDDTLRQEGICQAKEDCPIAAIVAAYRLVHGWEDTSVDGMFECPTEEEIREDLEPGQLVLDVGFLGGSSSCNQYNISVWPVSDDSTVGVTVR